MEIKRVLIVLNELQDMQSVIDRGFEFANNFNALVEILYVHETPLFDIKELFSDKEFNKDEVKAKIEEHIERYSQNDIPIFVKIDDTQDRIWDLLRDDKETLVVQKYHKDITPKVIDTIKQPIFIIKQNSKIENLALLFESLEDIDEVIEFIKSNITNSIELVYNFIYIPATDPIDPVVSTSYIESEVLLNIQEEQFSKLKQKHNLNGKMFINSVYEEIELKEYLNNYSTVAITNIESDFLVSTKEEIIEGVNRDIWVL